MFQKSVIKEFLKTQDKDLINKRFLMYEKYRKKQEDIKKFEETDYQEGFLRDMFENCLGYTLYTTDTLNYNLKREKKNETNGKKADGAIYNENKEVIGVIELKGQNTKNLDVVEDQAFGYHRSHSKSKYVIISNFNELRLYVDKAIEYEKFMLFNLNKEKFEKLNLLLSCYSIQNDIPLKIKEKSSTFEKDISEQLYKDYSLFRTHLFENIIKNNPKQDKILLLRLTQKLCDRIIFILFAEDRGLLNPNTIKEIRQRHSNDITNTTMYEFYKIYFNGINNKNEKLNIPKYNGGLFAKDDLLDSLIIDDNVLDMEAQTLSDYDFEGDISVNILGHIFEQSLSDLEEMQAKINGFTFKKKNSKKTEDGVFYTPPHITKYIVNNTLGNLCLSQKDKLKLIEIKPPKNREKLSKSEKQILANIYKYREYLLSLKILDPACGSGAFLNQALEFLIKEHTFIEYYREMYEFRLEGLEDISLDILENNLYGVDISEDATEIAKLSLWIMTASRGKELINLSKHIICANSLIDMPFDEGSFDVVIGNPPYVKIQRLKSNYENESLLYEEKYLSATGKYDLYALFLEMSFKMIKDNGKLTYIIPHKFLISDSGSGIREFLLKNKAMESILHFGGEMVFRNVSAYTSIVTLSHNNKKIKFKHIKPKDIFNIFQYEYIDINKLSNNKWHLQSESILDIIHKITNSSNEFNTIFSESFKGVDITMGDDIFMMKGLFKKNKFLGYSNRLKKYIELEKDIMKPLLKGQDIKKYMPLSINQYVLYSHYLDKNDKTKPYTESDFKEKFPLAYIYLLNFKEELILKKKKYKTNPIYWFSLHRARSIKKFEANKLITPFISEGSNFTIDNNNYFFNANNYGLIQSSEKSFDIKYYLSILNSNLIWFYIKNTSSELRGGFFQYAPMYLEKITFPNVNNEAIFIKKSNLMLKLNKQLQEVKQNFIDELGLEKIPLRLQSFENLNLDEFIEEYKEAKKIKTKDKLEERNLKNDWKSLFENDTKISLDLQLQIKTTEKEIDNMVYALYGLNDDEINIVESTKG